MKYSTVPYDTLRVRVQDKSTLAWTDITNKGNELKISRGGTVGVLGLSSVNAGVLELVLYNDLDPASVATLSPKMAIQVYSTQFTDPNDGSIFLGNIVDINSYYVMNRQYARIDTYVKISAVDAIYSHNNVVILGVTTTPGYQRWEERISTLSSSSLTTINVPAINTNTVVDSF